MNLAFTYAGTVEANTDPLKLGRLKVRVPHVYGSDTSSGYVGTNDLPWALPAGMPAGGSAASGGFSQLPERGDKVFVRFLDGEPEKPIWEWGMQSVTDRDALKLHEYGSGVPVGAPDRAILSRYGNSLEIKESAVTLTTKQGYQVRLENSTGETGGSAALQTPAGQRITLNDLTKTMVLQGLDTAVMSAGHVILNAASDAMIKAAGSLSMLVGGTLVTIQSNSVVLCTGTGATLIVDTDGNITMLSAGGASVSMEGAKIQLASANGTAFTVEDSKMSITTPQLGINASAVAVGVDAKWPAVMMTSKLLQWILTHTHTNGNDGSPTGPAIPIPGVQPDDFVSQRMYLT